MLLRKHVRYSSHPCANPYSHSKIATLFSVFVFLLAEFIRHRLCGQRNARIGSIPIEYSYKLNSPDFNSSLAASWLGSTSDTNSTTTSVLHDAAEEDTFAYDDELYQIFGYKPQSELVAQRDHPFAAEAGVWVWDRDDIWFTGPSLLVDRTELGVLDLKTGVMRVPNTSTPVTNPNGGYYFDGTLYFTMLGNETSQRGVASPSLPDLTVKLVLDPYFGLRSSGTDDVVWVKKGKNSFMYFAVPDLGPLAQPFFPGSALTAGQEAQLPNAVWMFDPEKDLSRPVIGRNVPSFERTYPGFHLPHRSDRTSW